MSLQNHMLDGFYVAYVTGAAGIGQVLFVVAGEKIVGADAGGLKYDGKIVILPGQGGHRCSLIYSIPAGAATITGAPPSPQALELPLEFDLPINFLEGVIVRIQTPLGAVNAKFEKLRSLDLNS